MQIRFRLIPYFTLTSLIAFACVASAMIYFQTRESALLESAHSQRSSRFAQLQSVMLNQTETALRGDVLAAHQDSNAELARLLSSALWSEALAPFLTAIEKLDSSLCRSPSQRKGVINDALASPQTQVCLRQHGPQIQALASYAALDVRLQRAMQGSSVGRIRIHDLQGTTLYSTERAQVGKDSSSLPGWQRAVGGLPASAIQRQEPSDALHPSTLREVIASHVPLIDPRTNRTLAVFEVQSDITPALHRVQQTSEGIRQTAADQQVGLEQHSLDQRRHAQRAEQVQLMTLAGLLVLLYAVLYSIVRRAHAVIEKQAQESDANKQRLAQSEKMTSLGNMVASVAHQLNTPLAFSRSNVFMAIQALKDMAPGIHSAARVLDSVATNAGDMAASGLQDLDTESVRSQLSRCPEELSMTQDMLGDVLTGLNQMNEMVDNLRSFTRMDRSRTAEVDLNTTLSSVIYIARAVISTKVQVVQKFSRLPLLECQVSQLNQVFLNLIMNAAQAIDGAGVVTVSTATHGHCIRITVEDTGSGIPDDVLPRIFEPYFTTKPQGASTGLGLAIARDIVVEHGGTLSVATRMGIGTTFQIEFPIPTGPSA
jgi:two-component system, NtrC family, sensor kinase